MENTNELHSAYEEAKEHLSNTEMLSPVYYILSGTKPDQVSRVEDLQSLMENMINRRSCSQACIITRSWEKADSVTEITSRKDPWFILQTNYDPDVEV